MENKKTKLTLSGIAKKSIENIELAKTQSKNSVVIEKNQIDFLIKDHLTDPQGLGHNRSQVLEIIILLHQDPQLFQNLRLQLLMTLKSVNLLNNEQQEDLKVKLLQRTQKEKLDQRKENLN